MSQFESGNIILQLNDKIGFNFLFPAASGSTDNDGAIPYGRTISSVAVTAYDSDGTDVTSELISGTPTLDTETVTAVLQYPDTSGDGRYKLTFVLTLDNGWEREFDFKTIYAKTI